MKKVFLVFGLVLAIGVNAQQKRQIGDYSKLNVRDSFDVTLVADSKELVINTDNKDILNHIKTEIVNNTLSIYFEEGYRKHGEVKIMVPYRSLDEITLSGSGSISNDGNISAKNLKIGLTGSGNVNLTISATNAEAHLEGSGDMTLKGKTENFSAEVVGSGDLEAQRLSAQNTEVKVVGSGDAKVFASGQLSAKVEGSGDIEYAGNPKKEETKVSGSGSIDKI